MKDMTHCIFSDEGNSTITNEIHGMLHKNFDEGNMKIANKTCDILQHNSDEGNKSIMQDFEKVEKVEINNNSATNYSNIDYFLENNSSRESQHSRKSVVTVFLNVSGR